MGSKPLTDKEIFDRALTLLGSQVKIADFVGVSQGAVSQWKTRPMSPMARKILVEGLKLEGVPWMDLEWQKRHQATKALQQVAQLFYRTKALGPDWIALEALLDRLQPFPEPEWRNIWEGKVDYMVEPGKAPARKKQA